MRKKKSINSETHKKCDFKQKVKKKHKVLLNLFRQQPSKKSVLGLKKFLTEMHHAVDGIN